MPLEAALLSLVTSTTIGFGEEVGGGVGFAAEFEFVRDGCVPGTGLPDEVMLQVLRSPRLHFHFRYRWHS